MATNLQFSVADATLVSRELIRWANECRKQGIHRLSIAMAMATTGATLAVGPEVDDDFRTAWVAWLRGVAGSRRPIEDASGKPAAPGDVAAPTSLLMETQPESGTLPSNIKRTDQSQSLREPPRSSAKPGPTRRILGALLLLFLPILVSGGVTFVSTSQMEPVYGAESEILFDLGTRQDVLEKFLATQAVLARSEAVLRPVSEAFGVSRETLEDNLSIEFLRGSVVMRLRYADKDVNKAVEINRAVVGSYTQLLSDITFFDTPKHILVTARALDEPLWPKPFQAAAVGIAVGMAIGIASLALIQALRTGL